MTSSTSRREFLLAAAALAVAPLAISAAEPGKKRKGKGKKAGKAGNNSQSGTQEGFVPLFNGKDLEGWEGDTKLWSAQDGVLVGKAANLPYNDFLSTKKEYGDFILKFKIKLVDGKGNSGVQIRSQRVPGAHEVKGYQCDYAVAHWSALYYEWENDGHRKLAEPTKSMKIDSIVKPTEWNDYEVRAEGDKITMWLNGVKTVEYVEKDPAMPRKGIIAVQVHSGDPMEVQFRDMLIKELPAAGK